VNDEEREAWVRETLDRLAADNEPPWTDAAPEETSSSEGDDTMARKPKTWKFSVTFPADPDRWACLAGTRQRILSDSRTSVENLREHFRSQGCRVTVVS
jgi:hypothetical protein